MLKPKAISAAIALSVYVTATAAVALPPQASMDDMHGDCGDFSWDMSAEFAAWNEQPLTAIAATTQGDSATLPLNQAVTLTLAPHAAVSFIVAPEKDRSDTNTYSGLIAFIPDTSGLYRLSASNGSWIDAVQGGRAISSTRFEMQTECQQIFKSLAFELSAGEPVWFQINGSKTELITVLISRWNIAQ